MTHATSFKTHYNNHTKSTRDAVYSKETALLSYIWKLKMEKRDYIGRCMVDISAKRVAL